MKNEGEVLRQSRTQSRTQSRVSKDLSRLTYASKLCTQFYVEKNLQESEEQTSNSVQIYVDSTGNSHFAKAESRISLLRDGTKSINKKRKASMGFFSKSKSNLRMMKYSCYNIECFDVS